MNAIRILGCLLVVVVACSSVAAQVTTTQSASSSVDANGMEQVRDDDATVDGFASTQAIWPPGPPAPDAQARTAARSRSTEIAANARIFDTAFSFQQFDLALSNAFYAIDVDPAVIARDAGFDFFLPPSYVEFVSNAELPRNELEASFFADLRVCQSSACVPGDSVFYFQVNGTGSYTDSSHSVILDGDPSLDLTPLMNPTVTDTTMSGFERTYLVEFPEFAGHVDLGRIPAAVPLRVEYTLQARASGQATFNSAIAAINDPFLLDTDPVRQGPPMELTVTPVPEPSALALLVLLLGACLAGHRPR